MNLDVSQQHFGCRFSLCLELDHRLTESRTSPRGEGGSTVDGCPWLALQRAAPKPKGHFRSMVHNELDISI